MKRPATSISAVATLSEIGQAKPGDARKYVEPFGLTHDDVPALVELAKRWADDAHFKATSPSSAMWGPIHAWRALGELRAQVVIPTFLEMLDPLERSGDDWFFEEFPPLCKQIGTPVMELLVTYLLDAQHSEYARVAVAHGLQVVAGVDPSARDRVCEALASALRPLSDEHPELNAFLVSYLTDLEAVEQAGLIERAFDAGVVSEFVCGDWAEIAFELGVGPRPTGRPSFEWQRMPERPIVEAPRAARASRSKMDKAAQKRQRQARKKNRRR